MTYTLKQAAEATGKSKPTVLRAIQAGKISARRDDATQGWLIDPAELHRVYPPLPNDDTRTDTQHPKSDALKRDATVENAVETGVLRQEVALLREMLADRDKRVADKEETIADLRQRLDREGEERRAAQLKLTALLTDQSEKPEMKAAPVSRRRSWLQRLTGSN